MSLPTRNNVNRPEKFGYDVRIDDNYFRLSRSMADKFPFVDTDDLQPQAMDTRENPEDMRPTFGQIFSRSDFTGGEGLAFAHRRGQEDTADRYWSSRGVNVRAAGEDEAPHVQLSRTIAEVDAIASGSVRVATDSTSVWATSATTLRRTDDPLAVAPTFVNDDPHNGEAATTVEDVAALGDETYAALGVNGIHRKSSGAWAHWNDLAATRVWEVNARIMASEAQSIYEVETSGVAPTALHTLPSGETWAACADGGSHILAGGTDGNVYAFTDEAGALALTAQTPFPGESITALAATRGKAAVATVDPVGGKIGRLWVGDLHESGRLVNMQLVRQWGDQDTTIDRSPHALVATRDDIFAAVQDKPGTSTDLWRYSLADAALSSDGIVAVAGESRGILVLGGRPLVAVDGGGLYRRTAATFETDGYLIGPLADHFVDADKVWAGAMLDLKSIPLNANVELFYSTDAEAIEDPNHVSWTSALKATSNDPDERPLPNVTSRYLVGMLKLRGDGTSTPQARSFAFRSYPGPSDVIATFPIDVSDRYERPGKAPGIIPGLGERLYQVLRGREGTYAEVEIFSPAEKLRGVIKKVSLNADRQGFGRVKQTECWVTFLGRRAGDTGGSEDEGAMGVGTLGVVAFG